MPPCSSPLASRCQVPTFCTAAWSPAHAACMPATVWAKHRLLPDSVPGLLMGPGFDGFYHWISAPDRRFTFVRLLGPHLTSSPLAFSTDAHHASYHPRAALGGLKPGPATRLRGALPHRLYSLLFQGFRLISASWRTSSSAQDSHPHALTEPYLNLSVHTALHVLASLIGGFTPSFHNAIRSGRLRANRPR